MAQHFLSRNVRDDFRCIIDPAYSVFAFGDSARPNPNGCDNQAWDGLYMDSYSHQLAAPMQNEFWHFGQDTLVVVIGVNHGLVKHLGYSSIMVSGLDMNFESPKHSAIWATAKLNGTASKLWSEAGNLFLVAISRDCSPFPESVSCTEMPTDIIKEVEIAVVDRIYLEIETATGPLPSELLESEVIIFRKGSAPTSSSHPYKSQYHFARDQLPQE